MELEKKYIHMNREKGKAFTQITLDDDFNVPDLKPDLMRIIWSRASLMGLGALRLSFPVSISRMLSARY